MGRTDRALIAAAAVACSAFAVALLVPGHTDTAAPPPMPAATSTSNPAGPCDGLTSAQLTGAFGTTPELEVDSPARCHISPPGTSISVTVEQVSTGAEPSDIDDIEPASGPDADSLDPWPRDAVLQLGPHASWFGDPRAVGSTGELYWVKGSRLLRITVSTPPGYRRTAHTIATAVGTAVDRRL